MTNYIIITSSEIVWRILTNSQSQYKLKSIKDFGLLSPYQYFKAYKSNGLIKYIDEKYSGKCFIHTKGLIFKTGNNFEDKQDIENLFEYLRLFFRHLRFESKQVNISIDGSISSIVIQNKVPKGIPNIIPQTSAKGLIRSDYYYSMITWETIKFVDKNIKANYKIPVYEEMLLEAWKANIEAEYNKAILFSVISVESLLAHTFDQIYENEKLKHTKSKTLRMIKNNDGKYKDPIFITLNERSDFKKLLHEIPLYLIKSSLLLEKESVYSNLLKMYTTRNKIVHWGAPIENTPNKFIPVNLEGSKISISTAIEVFNWIGITRFNNLLTTKFIEMK